MPNKKWLAGLLAVVLLLISLVPAALAESATITSNTKVYKEPRTSSASISVSKGMKVTIVAYGTGSYSDWVRIKNSSNGAVAYIKGKYLSGGSGNNSDDGGENKDTTFTAYVAVDSLTLFKEPSGTADKIGALSYGRAITVLGTKGSWAQIKNASGTGYALIAGLSKTKPDDPITVYAAEDAYIYKSNSSSSGRYGSVQAGTKVTVYDISGNWCKVAYNGTVAYMKKSQLSSSPKAPGNSGGYEEISKTGYVQVETLKAYSSSSTSSSVVAILNYGTSVQVNAVSKNGTWARFKYNGQDAFVLCSGLSTTPLSSNPGGTARPGGGSVLLVDWFNSDIQSVFSPGTMCVVTDIDSGISWNAVRRNSTNHADVEPLTQADTDAMRRACADKNGNWTYIRHAVWVTIDGQKYAGSIYTEPHGVGQIESNGYAGHLCIHFLNSRTHGTNKVDADHQAMVMKAYYAGQ